MQWPNLTGKVRIQPVHGTWHDWKKIIADHCEGQCVYCAISEARFGGIRNFHIEHFRPKSKFRKLENSIQNLYLACAICNVLKSDDWPAAPRRNHSLASYPDPSVTDYNTLFSLSQRTYKVSSRVVAGKYVIERILLNRGQLILERRLFVLLKRLKEFEAWAGTSIDSMTGSEAKEASKVLLAISKIQTGVLQARPYHDDDTKRPTKAKAAKTGTR